MQGRPLKVDADNGFMVKKDVEGLLIRCQTIMSEKSTHIKSFHFRIPICIGFSSDLTPEEFESFVDQIQTVVDQKNREIDSKMASSSSMGLFDVNAQQKGASEHYYAYTFYLYPNEDSQAQAQIQAWMQANAKQIQSLVDSKCLLTLPEWRNSPEWVNALKDYEDFIESGFRSMKLDAKQNAKSPSSPDECLTLDATRFLDSWKKQHPGQKPSIPLADAKETVKRKVVDFLFWGIKKDAPSTRASLLIHYASPSKAMLNMFPHMEALGYVAFSCVYQEFKKNKNMKKPEIQVPPLALVNSEVSPHMPSPRHVSSPRYISSPRLMPGDAYYDSDSSSMTSSGSMVSSMTASTDTAISGGDSIDEESLERVVFLYARLLTKEGFNPDDAAHGAVVINRSLRAQSSGSYSAPATPIVAVSPPAVRLASQAPGVTVFNNLRGRTASQSGTLTRTMSDPPSTTSFVNKR